MYQSVVIAGRLGKDPSMRYTANGKAVTEFSVAVDGRSKDDKPEWFNVICWERSAEAAAQYLVKGSKVLCAGRMQTRTWEGQDGKKNYRTELIADRVQFLDSRSGQLATEGFDSGEDIDPDNLNF